MSQTSAFNLIESDLVKQEFLFGSKRITIESVSNLDDLVDQISDDLFNVDERLPYWAELWPSAIALSRFVTKHPELVRNKTVLELGCGLGLTSISISLQHPACLMLTDYEQDALDMTSHNFKLNRLPLPELKILDWRSPDFDTQFELIIASDVLYEKRFFQPLIKLFQTYLKPSGKFIIAEPNRPIARSFFQMFVDYGYSFSVTTDLVTQNKQEIKVSIYTIVQKKFVI